MSGAAQSQGEQGEQGERVSGKVSRRKPMTLKEARASLREWLSELREKGKMADGNDRGD